MFSKNEHSKNEPNFHPENAPRSPDRPDPDCDQLQIDHARYRGGENLDPAKSQARNHPGHHWRGGGICRCVKLG